MRYEDLARACIHIQVRHRIDLKFTNVGRMKKITDAERPHHSSLSKHANNRGS